MDNKKIMPRWISTALAIGMLGTTLLACSNGGQAEAQTKTKAEPTREGTRR